MDMENVEERRRAMDMENVENGRPPDAALAPAPQPPFAAQFKRYRAAAGLTQEELAARAGVSVRSIGDLERGAGHRPRTDTAALLAAALEVPPDARAAFVAAARRPPCPSDDGASAPTATVALPTAGAPHGRRLGRPGQPLVAGVLGALTVVLLGVVVWVRGPAAPPRTPSPVVRVAVSGPGQAACCWATRGAWYADPAHGYPGFAGPTDWTWAHGATRPPLAAVRWSFAPPPRVSADGRHVTVDVWIPDNNADARVTYVVTDGRGRPQRRAVDQESPAPGFAHRSPGWVRLGVFDGTRDGRRWGGLVVELTDQASTDCAAYHYASRTCVIGAAQVRFSSPTFNSP